LKGENIVLIDLEAGYKHIVQLKGEDVRLMGLLPTFTFMLKNRCTWSENR